MTSDIGLFEGYQEEEEEEEEEIKQLRIMERERERGFVIAVACYCTSLTSIDRSRQDKIREEKTNLKYIIDCNSFFSIIHSILLFLLPDALLFLELKGREGNN